MSEQNDKNTTAKPAAAKAADKPADKPAAKPADKATDKPAAEAKAAPKEANSAATLWKRVALALFVVAGLAAVAAVDFASDASKLRGDMTALRAEVAGERAALKAEQDKFMKESADIADAVAKAKDYIRNHSNSCVINTIVL